MCFVRASGEASCAPVSTLELANSCQPAITKMSERRSAVLAWIVKRVFTGLVLEEAMIPLLAAILAGISFFVHSNTASASISTSISGEINLLTSTMLVAGRIAPKNSPCARPIFSQSAILVTKIRVRTTLFKEAPAFTSAASIFRIVCIVCAYGSPTPTILPSGPVAVVPETAIAFPIRTALE